MPLDPTTLFLLWFGGGFVVVLLWSALLGQVLMGTRLAAVRPCIGALAAIGFLHPAAAVGAVDLVRLCRTVQAPASLDPAIANDPAHQQRAAALALPSWALAGSYAVTAVSVVVAIALFVAAGGLP